MEKLPGSNLGGNLRRLKKAAILISAFLLIVGMSFAQEPQKPVKKAEPAKTEQTDKSKADCAKKTEGNANEKY